MGHLSHPPPPTTVSLHIGMCLVVSCPAAPAPAQPLPVSGSNGNGSSATVVRTPSGGLDKVSAELDEQQEAMLQVRAWRANGTLGLRWGLGVFAIAYPGIEGGLDKVRAELGEQLGPMLQV